MSARAVYRHWIVLFTGQRAAEACYLGTAPKGDSVVLDRAKDQVAALRCEGYLMRAKQPCEVGACDNGPGKILAEVGGGWLDRQDCIADLRHRAGRIVRVTWDGFSVVEVYADRVARWNA